MLLRFNRQIASPAQDFRLIGHGNFHRPEHQRIVRRGFGTQSRLGRPPLLPASETAAGSQARRPLQTSPSAVARSVSDSRSRSARSHVTITLASTYNSHDRPAARAALSASADTWSAGPGAGQSPKQLLSVAGAAPTRVPHGASIRRQWHSCSDLKIPCRTRPLPRSGYTEIDRRHDTLRC